MKSEFFDALHHSNFFQLEDLNKYLFHLDQNNVWEALLYLKEFFNRTPLGQIAVDLPPNVFLERPEKISIGEGTIVEPGAFIRGPCIIGKRNVIRHGAYIRGNVLTGDDCIIGHDTEIKHSILLSHVNAAHFAYIGDSILGNHVNLGAGVKCANFRLDKKEVQVIFKGEKYSTGLKKFGAIIGDFVQIGCNAVLNPGTIIGKHARCYPCMNIGGFIPPHAIVKAPFANILTNKD